MTRIRIVGVSKVFGRTRAVDNVSLEIAPGELFFLLGPSGCGKTTLLRLLAGFCEPSAGELYFDDRRLNDVRPQDRGTGMVFQNYALWPHMTVAENVAYGLEVRRVPAAERRRRVAQVLDLVGLGGYADRRPAELSGGQQQRVAVARALVVEPRVLLLDEPLSNLDAKLRTEMREEIRRLHRQTRVTTVYVTHDQEEALSLADRLAVLHEGRLQQVGTPLEVYRRPASAFVAGFIGETNLVAGEVVGSRPGGRLCIRTGLGELEAPAPPGPWAPGQRVHCSLRPEALRVAEEGLAPGPNVFTAELIQAVFVGGLYHLHLAAGPDQSIRLRLKMLAGGEEVGRPGQRLTIVADGPSIVCLPS